MATSAFGDGISFLVCPATRQPLLADDHCLVVRGANERRYPVRDGIPILLPDGESDPSFESLHSAAAEPWHYSQRAAEILRHRSILSRVASLRTAPGPTLDVGCSRGQLTRRLVEKFGSLAFIDLSFSAVHATRETLPADKDTVCAVASACALPFADHTFGLLFACDGLAGWNLPDAQRRIALAEFHRVLAPGGHAVLTDYLHPTQFPAWERVVGESGLEVVAPLRFHDRLWYLLEARLANWPAHFREAFSRSVFLAKGLAGISRALGDSGSNHLGMILRRT